MEQFALSQKLEDLAVEVHKAMEQYPKHEKYGLAKETEAAINEYVVQRLGLTMNSKSQVMSGHQSIPFCGFQIRPTHICPNKPTLRRGKRRLRKLAYLCNRDVIDLATFRASLMSFLGHYKYCDSNRSVESVLETIKLTGERK